MNDDENEHRNISSKDIAALTEQRRTSIHKVQPPPGYANSGVSSDKSFFPADRLAELGNLYRGRNKVYGDTYKNFGPLMKAFFPAGITIQTEEDWTRMSLFFHAADKFLRYASTFNKGGHIDSLDDAAVYLMMLQEIDSIIRGTEDSTKAK